MVELRTFDGFILSGNNLDSYILDNFNHTDIKYQFNLSLTGPIIKLSNIDNINKIFFCSNNIDDNNRYEVYKIVEHDLIDEYGINDW